jgi:hypothetical protein
VTGSFTLGAVSLTYLGSGWRERRRRIREERASYNQKIAEVAAAADDLRQRVRLYRNAWALGSERGTAAGIEVGRIAQRLLPDSAAPKLREYLGAVLLTTASELAADGLLGRLVNTAGMMYLQAVTPAHERLITATASLRISPDTVAEPVHVCRCTAADGWPAALAAVSGFVGFNGASVSGAGSTVKVMVIGWIFL